MDGLRRIGQVPCIGPGLIQIELLTDTRIQTDWNFYSLVLEWIVLSLKQILDWRRIKFYLNLAPELYY